MLSPDDTVKLRKLIGGYLGQRISFYEARDREELGQIYDQTEQLEADLSSALRASESPVPLIVTGVNDMLNSCSSAESAWSNRIYFEAWALMAAIALCGNALIGYGARKFSSRTAPILILPTVVVIARVADSSRSDRKIFTY